MTNFSPVSYMSRPMRVFLLFFPSGRQERLGPDRGLTMAGLIESREDGTDAENETRRRNQQ
jgi:hypothetical protein